MITQNIFPCIFTGDITKKNSIVTISLNPHYSENGTQLEQGNSINDWFSKCIIRFNNYETDKKIHRVFKNLLKIIYGVDFYNNCNNKKELLQSNIINLDWCPYYSQSYPTINNIINDCSETLFQKFNKNLEENLKELNPKLIIIHGKSLEYWIRNQCFDLNNNQILQSCEKHGVYFKVWLFEYNKKTPLVYINYFLNYIVNNWGNEGLNSIYTAINHEIFNKSIST